MRARDNITFTGNYKGPAVASTSAYCFGTAMDASTLVMHGAGHNSDTAQDGNMIPSDGQMFHVPFESVLQAVGRVIGTNCHELKEATKKMTEAAEQMVQTTQLMEKLLKPPVDDGYYNEETTNEQQIEDQEKTTYGIVEIKTLKQQTEDQKLQIEDQDVPISVIVEKIENLEKQINHQTNTNNTNQEGQKTLNSGIWKKLNALTENQDKQGEHIRQLQLKLSQCAEEHEQLQKEKLQDAQKFEQLQNTLLLRVSRQDEELTQLRKELEQLQKEPIREENDEETKDTNEQVSSDMPNHFMRPIVLTPIVESQAVSPPPCVLVSNQRVPKQKDNKRPLIDWPPSFSVNRPTILDRLQPYKKCQTPRDYAPPICGCGCINHPEIHNLLSVVAVYNEKREEHTGKPIYCGRKRQFGTCVQNGCKFSHTLPINLSPCAFHFSNRSVRSCIHGANCNFAHDEGRIGDIPKTPSVPGLSIRLVSENGNLAVQIRKV